MSSTRTRLYVLAALTVAVAASGVVALGVVCDFEVSCGEPVDRSYELVHEDPDEALVYSVVLDEGVVLAETVSWSEDPPPPASDDAEGDTFVLTVHKNEVPLEAGAVHTLLGGNGTITWDSASADTGTHVGDEFLFTLYRQAGGEEIPVHRVKVSITR